LLSAALSQEIAFLEQNRPILYRPPAALRARAAEYQHMARDCRSMGVVAALLRIADRYEALAIQREQEDEEAEGPVMRMALLTVENRSES
jgi:hypothetical protein